MSVFQKVDFYSDSIEVLVVGGGPVGLSTAMELGLRGIKVVIVEPRKEVSHLRPRAKTTNARSMEHFRRLGIAKDIRAAAALKPKWSQEVSFCTSLLGKETVRFDDAWAVSSMPNELYSEGGQSIPQFTLEEVLREKINASENIRFATGWELVSLTQDDHKVIAELKSETGETVTVESLFLIGCDGARSNVRRSIGIVFEGDVETRNNFNVVFKAPGLAEQVKHDRAIQYWVVNDVAPGLMGRLDLDETWWMMIIGVEQEDGEANPKKYIHGMIGEEVEVEVLATDAWSSRMLLANHYRNKRVFLAGDAAHLNPPWGGLGFNTGLGDAVDIAWKLSAFLRGWGGEELLDSYEEERRPISERVIKTATHNMKTLSSDLAKFETNAKDELESHKQLADHIYKTKEMEFHSLGLVLGYQYDQSSIIVEDVVEWPEESIINYVPTSRPGARLPHTWLGEDHSIFDQLGPYFTLLRLDSSLDIHAFEKAAAARNIPVKVVTLEQQGLLEKYEKPLILVRPDQHVAWRGERLSSSEAAKILNIVCGLKEKSKI